MFLGEYSWTKAWDKANCTDVFVLCRKLKLRSCKEERNGWNRWRRSVANEMVMAISRGTWLGQDPRLRMSAQWRGQRRTLLGQDFQHRTLLGQYPRLRTSAHWSKSGTVSWSCMRQRLNAPTHEAEKIAGLRRARETSGRPQKPRTTTMWWAACDKQRSAKDICAHARSR